MINNELLTKLEADPGKSRLGEVMAEMISEKVDRIRKADESGRPYYLVWGEPVFLDEKCPVAREMTCCIP